MTFWLAIWRTSSSAAWANSGSAVVRKARKSAPVTGSVGVAIRVLLVGQIKELSIPVPLQEYLKSFHEAISLVGIVAGDVFEVGAQEDQAAGALFAFGGGDSGLGALDLAFEVVALSSLSGEQFLFSGFELLFEGFLAGE